VTAVHDVEPILFAGVWAALLALLMGMCRLEGNRDVRRLATVLFVVVLLGGPSLAVATH
jgi:hypothetical protein